MPHIGVVKKEITGGGITTQTDGGWRCVEAFGYRNWTFQLYGTAGTSFTVNLEYTTDPNNVLSDKNGNFTSTSEGHADAATIPANPIPGGTGITDFGTTTVTMDKPVAAVRVNVTAISGATVKCGVIAEP